MSLIRNYCNKGVALSAEKDKNRPVITNEPSIERNPRILLVDDEPDFLFILKRRLEQTGYETITAGTGIDALQKVRNETPDLILLDLMLPGIDGYQICSILRHDVRYMKIPVLILTARTQLKDYEFGMKAGADAYITKPVNHKVLLAKIAELLQKANPPGIKMPKSVSAVKLKRSKRARSKIKNQSL